MKIKFFVSFLIAVIVLMGANGQLFDPEDNSIQASTTTSFGMWEYVAPRGGTQEDDSCVSWYINSNFDWIVRPYYTTGTTNYLAQKLNAAGKKVILRTIAREGTIYANRYNWTDIYNSLQGDKTLYNEALGHVITQINENGIENLYAITIGEEEPLLGYWWNNGAVNIEHFIAVHNQMYDDLKARFPGIKVFAFVHIAVFTDTQIATLKRDGLVDDVYSANLEGILKPWFQRMMRLGGEETYCIVHGSGGLDADWYATITPEVVTQTAELAQSLGVPNFGWWACDLTVSPSRSILFNDWPDCADLNDPYCADNYKNTIINIISTAIPTPTPTDEPDGYITGDANEDGMVNSVDVTKIERIMMMLDPVTPSADANSDGSINALDITHIELIMMNN